MKKMKKFVSLALGISIMLGSANISFAGSFPFEKNSKEEEEFLYAYWPEELAWEEEYGYDDKDIDFSSYSESGKSISKSEIDDLSDHEKIARTILGEVCDLRHRSENAFAVAQTMKNRMNENYHDGDILDIVELDYAAYGEVAFRKPLKHTYLEGDYDLWATCMFLADCLLQDEDIPIPSGYTDIGDCKFQYDIKSSPELYFYISKTKRCDSKGRNITKAKYYKYNGKLYKIEGEIYKISKHIYYNWDDK